MSRSSDSWRLIKYIYRIVFCKYTLTICIYMMYHYSREQSRIKA